MSTGYQRPRNHFQSLQKMLLIEVLGPMQPTMGTQPGHGSSKQARVKKKILGRWEKTIKAAWLKAQHSEN